MDKKLMVRFLNEKKRGIYPIIVDYYADQIIAIGVNLALELIKEDLHQDTCEVINLNYFSLAQAIAKYKKGHDTPIKDTGPKKKYEFRDSHESKAANENNPGRFKIE